MMSGLSRPIKFVPMETPFSEFRETSEFWGDASNRISVTMFLPLLLAILASTLLVIMLVRLDRSESRLLHARKGAHLSLSDTVGPEDTNLEPSGSSDQSAAELGIGRLAPLFTREVLYWEKHIMGWATQYDVDPNIVATIMQIESCGNPQAVSVAGAQGLFQVMPFHFSSGENMLDPNTNASRGLAFFKEQMRYTNGDIFLSFAGYNGGYAASGGVYDNWPAETQRYFYWARGIYSDAKAGLFESPTLKEWLVAGGAGGCRLAATNLGLF